MVVSRFSRVTLFLVLVMCLGAVIGCKKQEEKEDYKYKRWESVIVLDSLKGEYVCIVDSNVDSYELRGHVYFSLNSKNFILHIKKKEVNSDVIKIDSTFSEKSKSYDYTYTLRDYSIVSCETVQVKDGKASVVNWSIVLDKGYEPKKQYSMLMMPEEMIEKQDIVRETRESNPLSKKYGYQLIKKGNEYFLTEDYITKWRNLEGSGSSFHRVGENHWKVLNSFNSNGISDYRINKVNGADILTILNPEGGKYTFLLRDEMYNVWSQSDKIDGQFEVRVLPPIYLLPFDKVSNDYVKEGSVGKAMAIDGVDDYISFKYPLLKGKKPIYNVSRNVRMYGGAEEPLNYRIYDTSSFDTKDLSLKTYRLIITGRYNKELYVMSEMVYEMNKGDKLLDFTLSDISEDWSHYIRFSSKDTSVIDQEYDDKMLNTLGGFRVAFKSQEGDVVNMYYDFAYNMDYVRLMRRLATDKYGYTWLITKIVYNDEDKDVTKYKDVKILGSYTYPFSYGE